MPTVPIMNYVWNDGMTFWQGSVLSSLNRLMWEIHSKSNLKAYKEEAEGQFKLNSRTLGFSVTVLQIF